MQCRLIKPVDLISEFLSSYNLMAIICRKESSFGQMHGSFILI